MERFKKIGLLTASAVLGLLIGLVSPQAVNAVASEIGLITGWYGSGSRNNTYQFKITSGTSVGVANFVPGTTNTNALGTTALRFSNVLSVLGNFSGAVTHSGAVTLGSAAPLIITPATVQSVAVNTTAISPSSSFVLIGSTGTITLVGTPTITTTSATTGQYLIIESTAASITLQDQATLAGSKLALSAATVAVTTSTPVSFIFDGTVWQQIK